MGVVSFVFGMLCMGRSIEMYSETSFTSTKTVFILGLVGIFLGIFWIKKQGRNRADQIIILNNNILCVE